MNLHSKNVNELIVPFLGKISINLVHFISHFSHLCGYLAPFDEATLFFINYEDFFDLFKGFLFAEHVLNQSIN
jgi:hypothetical protein